MFDPIVMIPDNWVSACHVCKRKIDVNGLRTIRVLLVGFTNGQLGPVCIEHIMTDDLGYKALAEMIGQEGVASLCNALEQGNAMAEGDLPLGRGSKGLLADPGILGRLDGQYDAEPNRVRYRRKPR